MAEKFLTPKELSKADLPTIGRELMKHIKNNGEIMKKQSKEMKEDNGFYGHMTVKSSISKSGGRAKTC